MSAAVGLTDELLDDVRKSVRAVLDRRLQYGGVRAYLETYPTHDSLADEVARNATAVVIAVLEERGIL